MKETTELRFQPTDHSLCPHAVLTERGHWLSVQPAEAINSTDWLTELAEGLGMLVLCILTRGFPRSERQGRANWKFFGENRQTPALSINRGPRKKFLSISRPVQSTRIRFTRFSALIITLWDISGWADIAEIVLCIGVIAYVFLN